MNNSIQSKVLKTELVNWRTLSFIQDDNFKDLSPEALERLKSSVLQNQFAQPFYVWQDKAELYCLDGKHRTIILSALEGDGVEVPDMLPATFIDCKDKKEAAKFVLIYSSIYAKISNDGLYDFINLYDIDFEDLKLTLDLPDIDLSDFETKFLKEDYSGANTEIMNDDLNGGMIIKFELPRETFIQANKRLNEIMSENEFKTQQEAFLFSLGI